MAAETTWHDGMSEVYDRYLGPAHFAPYPSFLADVAAGPAPQRVLELAAGTGLLTAELVDRLPAAEVVATDLNPAMVSYAKARVRGPTWQVADAQRLDFPEASFDLVVCRFGAMFFPDRPAAFAQARSPARVPRRRHDPGRRDRRWTGRGDGPVSGDLAAIVVTARRPR